MAAVSSSCVPLCVQQSIFKLMQRTPTSRRLIHELSQPRTQAIFSQKMQEAKSTGEPVFLSREDLGTERSVFVTGEGDHFLVFNRAQQGDVLTLGGTKHFFDAVNLKSGEVAGYYSIDHVKSSPDANQEEYQKTLELIGLAISRSLINNKRAKKGGFRTVYLVTRWEGDLEKLLRLHLFSSARCVLEAKKILGALADFHAKGFVYRDVKLDNILYRGLLKDALEFILCDLGLAHRIGDSIDSVMGSFAYASPLALQEAMTSSQVCTYSTQAHDCWGMGVVLLVLFSKQLNPFFLQSNPNLNRFLQTFLIEGPCSTEMQVLLREFWQEGTLSQKQWIQKPENENSLEYVLYQLLQVNPDARWGAVDAAGHLERIKGDSAGWSRPKLIPLLATSIFLGIFATMASAYSTD